MSSPRFAPIATTECLSAFSGRIFKKVWNAVEKVVPKLLK
jgi:hypothetical protein